MIRKLTLTLLFLSGIATCAAFVVWAEEAKITRPPVQYKATELRDPFANTLAKKAGSAGTKGGGMPTLKVTGVLWGSKNPQAIINGKVVTIGDKIEKAEVTDINKDGVTVRYGEQEYIINSPAVDDAKAEKKDDTNIDDTKPVKKDDTKGGKDEK